MSTPRLASSVPMPSEIHFIAGGVAHVLKPKPQEGKTISGVSEKAIYVDEAGIEYFVKKNKPRATKDLFGLSEERLQEIKSHYPEEYQNLEGHKLIVERTHLFLETLMPCITRNLFKGMIKVPENIFYIDQSTEQAYIISKKMDGFNEFMKDKIVRRHVDIGDEAPSSSPKHWDTRKRPTAEELKLTIEEANVIGKTLAFIYVFAAWDPWNNIDMSNSGGVKENGRLVPAVVDMGNMGPTGFGGKSKDESALLNQYFKNLSESKETDLMGYAECVPFVGTVKPLPPRQLVPELLTMMTADQAKSTIGFAMFQGFKEACAQLEKSLGHFDEDVRGAIQEVFAKYTNEKNIVYAGGLLNESFYFPESKDMQADTFVNVLRERVLSTLGILAELEQGVSLKKIDEERMQMIAQQQRFFDSAKAREGETGARSSVGYRKT